MLSVSEIFTSWQGEGRLTGVPSVFLRLAGCHLRCRFCDTIYAQNVSDGKLLPVENIVEKIVFNAQNTAFPSTSEMWKKVFFPEADIHQIPEPVEVRKISHVVLTGGEPFLFPKIIPLVHELRQRGLHVTIETSGTCALRTGCDLVSISPKMRNSGNSQVLTNVSGSLETLISDARDYQIKFVVDHPEDMEEILDFLRDFPFIERRRVLLMPQGKTFEEILARECWVQKTARENGFGYSPRAHLFWFDAKRGV